MTVPNQFPKTDPGEQRLAVVGECPGIEESTCQRCSRGHRFALQYWEEKRLQTRDRCPVPECCSREFTADPTPFVGWSGRLLDDVLAEAGLPREKVFVGNVSQVTQTAAELADPANPHVAAGLAVLRADLATFRPNIVLCLGNTALRAFHSDPKASVTNWRGSLFASTFLDDFRRLGALTEGIASQVGKNAVSAVPAEFRSAARHESGLLMSSKDDVARAALSPVPLDGGGSLMARPLETEGSSGAVTPVVLSSPSTIHPDAIRPVPPASPGPLQPGVASPLSPLSPFGPDCVVSTTGKNIHDASHVHPAGQLILAQDPIARDDAERAGKYGKPGGESGQSGLSLVQRDDRGNSTYVPVPLSTAPVGAPAVKDALRPPAGLKSGVEMAANQMNCETAPSLKCTASYHPAAVLRTPGWTALLRFDVARAVKEAATPVLALPEHRFRIDLSADEIVEHLHILQTGRMRVGFDLEGWAATGITDCSFAISKEEVFWVPLKRIDGSPWWPPITEQRIMAALRAVLEDPAVPKVCHAGTYEGFVLQWAHGITLRGLVDDTMLMWHELNAELDKGLETPASLLTTQPYWGTSRDATTEEERAVYNCTDSAVTLEIAGVMRLMLV